ncbi:MAG TPA: hypothetical protein VGK48_08835 [Terriglobia bacterium]|jgi:hypothetical protein
MTTRTTRIQTSDDPTDPVIISTEGQRIELRIGAARQGETRVAMLKISEARKVALELLLQAENLADENIAKKKRAELLKAEGVEGLF